jgi:RNA polymerase sigma-70 factor, ECF subfamily
MDISRGAAVIEFEDLYARYAPDVHRFALYLCGNDAQAQDITAETFVRLWTARDNVRLVTVKAYLFTIARNIYRHEQRHDSRHDELDDQLPDRAPGSHVITESRARLREVLRVLQTLPEIDRAALLLRALDEMPYAEIASALGISAAAARVKIHRARLRLAEARAVWP